MYSSAHLATINAHMKMMKQAGVGVVVVSWYPKAKADDNGTPGGPDELMNVLLDAAHAAGRTIAFHLEPYEGRTAQSMRDDVGYIVDTYGHHPALYRHPHRPTGSSYSHKRSSSRSSRNSNSDSDSDSDSDKDNKGLPLLYVYDSYNMKVEEWAKLPKPAAAGGGGGGGGGGGSRLGSLFG
jgi:glycoprotein endo-alpha-1,2-mannosidase